ncbi:MAG: histidine phosphatase family protein [Candidatus Aenigmarchaeota archaeon]|nr:histidine phosphatase family protein [Candidatus Aenigmarchaeota archaeon]
MFRAKETAEILGKELGCKVEIITGIRERNFYGMLTGMKRPEAKKKYPGQVGLLKDVHNTIKGGETYSHFKERVSKALTGILSQKHGNVAIVTHGGPIRCILREMVGAGELKRLDDCAVIEIEKAGNGLALGKMYKASL